MIPRTRAAVARLASIWALITVTAAPTGAQAVGYSLSVGSAFHTGCFNAPCACGPIQNAMTGTFALLQHPKAASFTSFDVIGLYWVAQFPQGPVTITGSGTYRVGGTGTVQQQLVLDLVIGSGPVRHFDSGLVPGGGDFPRIEADVSLYGELACADTVLHVRAGPEGGTLGVGTPGLALGPVGPNPFRAATHVAFTLRNDGPVHVKVLDPAGRCVRTLTDGDWLAAGTHTVAWDGFRDDGQRSTPGLYFLLVRSGGASERASVIKLR